MLKLCLRMYIFNKIVIKLNSKCTCYMPNTFFNFFFFFRKLFIKMYRNIANII